MKKKKRKYNILIGKKNDNSVNKQLDSILDDLNAFQASEPEESKYITVEFKISYGPGSDEEDETDFEEDDFEI